MKGFKLEVKFATSLHEAKPLLGEDIYGDHIDLILMDYDLGAGPKGDVGLMEVRDVFEFKDLIFYSAYTDKLAEIVAKTGVQGVFHSTREDLPDTVIGVFEALVKKVVDIDHSRGIVMGASSDIDHTVNLCLGHSFEKGDETHRKNALTIVANRMIEIRDRFEKAAEAIKGITHVTDLLGKRHAKDRLTGRSASLKRSQSRYAMTDVGSYELGLGDFLEALAQAAGVTSEI